MTSRPTIDLLGVAFRPLDETAAVAAAVALYDAEDPAFLVYANVHTVNLAVADASYRATLQRADLVLNDGKGVMLGARLIGRRFPVDLNGNHFTPLLLDVAAARGWRVFLYGGRPRVAERAARRLQAAHPGLVVAGVHDGYSGDDAEVAAAVRSSGAGFLLVALGNPKQERWLERNLAATGAALGVGVGGFVDFQAGEVRRAPEWMRRMGLEWVQRLALDPRRMWRRYLVGNPLFLARVLRQRLGRRKAAS